MPAAKGTFACWFGVLLLIAEVSLTFAAQNEPIRPKVGGILANDFQAPIGFEPNQGQTDDQVKFMARCNTRTFSRESIWPIRALKDGWNTTSFCIPAPARKPSRSNSR